MPGRADQLDSETFGIIVRGEDVDDFDVASVAGARICVVNPKRLAERLSAEIP